MPFAQIRALFAGRLPALAIFDLDGTLIDSVPDIARCVDAALQALGLAAVGEARVRGWVGRGSRGLLRDALTFSLDAAPDEALLQRALDDYLARYLADCTRDTHLLPGAMELIEALGGAGVRLCCVTNKPGAITRRVLAHFGLLIRFDTVLGGDSGAGVKPDPGPLLNLMARYSIAADDTLMIGDSRHDVGAARAAGVRVICREHGYNHGEDIRDEAPDLVVTQLCALL